MIVDEKYKYCWQHMRKTGGSYVQSFFYQYVNTAGIITPSSAKHYLGPVHIEHVKNNYKGKFQHAEYCWLLPEYKDQLELLISVRHPVEHWISSFCYERLMIKNFEYKDIREWLPVKTNNWEKRFSFSDELIRNLDSTGKAGYTIMKNESLSPDLIKFIDKKKITIGPIARGDLENNRITPMFEGQKPFYNRSRKHDKDYCRFILNEDEVFENKIIEYESYIMENFYS